jgi:hypothetical protein
MGVNASCPLLSFASDLTRVVGQASNATVLVRQSHDIYVRSDTGGSSARESCINGYRAPNASHRPWARSWPHNADQQSLKK